MGSDRAQGCLQNVVYGKYRELTTYLHSVRLLRMQRASAALPRTSSFRSAQARWQLDLSANYCSSRHGRIMGTVLKGRDVFSWTLGRSAEQAGQYGDCCVALTTVRTHVNDEKVINLPSNKFALPFWLHIFWVYSRIYLAGPIPSLCKLLFPLLYKIISHLEFSSW